MPFNIPEPTNEQRANRAHPAYDLYLAQEGNGEAEKIVFIDLFTDLMHLADQLNLDAMPLIGNALRHYLEESTP